MGDNILSPMVLSAECQPPLQSNVVIAKRWCNCNGAMDTDCVSILCMLFSCCLHGLILVVLAVLDYEDDIYVLCVALCRRQLTCFMRRWTQYLFQLMTYASADVKCSFASTFPQRPKMLAIHWEFPQVDTCAVELEPHFNGSPA